MRPVTTGVPQGSIVGTLLFNILINEIVMASQKFNFILYADDTTLNSTLDCFGNGEDEIQISITTELQKIFKWLDVNKLCLNTAKSKYMLFHMPQKILPELSFSFNGIPIKNVKEFNFLGLILDSNLNWKAHLNAIGAKIARITGLLRKLKYIFPKHKLIIICEKYANSHSITFNRNKSKLLCFNVDHTDVIPQTYLNGEVIPVVDSDKHLGNYISTNITDRNIIDNICDLYQRSNRVISDFRVCDSNALDSLYRTYCMHMYGCELWDLNCNYIKDFKVAWRKIKRRIWRLPYRAHNAIVHQLSYDIDHQLETRMIKFVHLCLNHCNHVCRSIIFSKLHCIKSTFASNYKYLSYRYNISHSDWYNW